MIFNAVRVLIPTMVMNFPKHFVMTPYLAAREYATLLGLALDQHDMKINIRDTYRAGIVDALFTLGVLKTGLCESDSVLAMDDLEGHIDPGTVYTEKVDYDNFVVDPAIPKSTCTRMRPSWAIASPCLAADAAGIRPVQRTTW
jgi:hypothetical protein